MIINVTISLLIGILLPRRPSQTTAIALEGAAPPSFFLRLPCLSIRRGVSLCATITFDIHTKKIKSTWPLRKHHSTPYNPTTMRRIIVMHREADGSA